MIERILHIGSADKGFKEFLKGMLRTVIGFGRTVRLQGDCFPKTGIMRQGLTVPHDWQTITADRLRGHEFCGECAHDLQRYFN